ncbi:MAG: CocE/NonD family hydrolase [Polyangiaceae bacterium]
MSDRADPTHDTYLRTRPARYEGYDRRSVHVTMRDGVRIALDVCLPAGHRTGRLPTILRQTRYYRRFAVLPVLERVLPAETLDPMNAPMRALMTSRGYAWVDVDVRGSGASFGTRPCPWYEEGEVRDGAEILEWITRQPWSNGRVGSTGVSYDGTAADFLATTGHPALEAIAPRYSLFDVYADVAFPGGLHSTFFTEAWERANEALDRNEPGEMVALVYGLRAHGELPAKLAELLDRRPLRRGLARALSAALRGVAPVDDDPKRTVLAAALASHAENFNVHQGALHTTFRDDVPPNSPLPGQNSDSFSPHRYLDRFGDVAVLGYAGWFDAAYAAAAIKRHGALLAKGRRSHLLVGPWIHGGLLDLDPDAPAAATPFDHAAELLRFFDAHLLDEPPVAPPLPPVRYFELGHGWHATEQWPPAAARPVELYFAEGRRLAPAPSRAGFDVAVLPSDVGAGPRSRYRTLLCPYLHADGRGRSAQGYVSYESDALDAELRVVGAPILVLKVAATEPDFAIFAYLEDVTPSGEARLVSEGCLRSIHRTELQERVRGVPAVYASFERKDALRIPAERFATHHVELLPLALRVRRGHRVRLVLGAADRDHFVSPTHGTVRWRIDLAGSRLILPALLSR